MLKLIKANFKTTDDCIILTIPLIIFMSVISWYFQYAKNSADSIPTIILAVVTLIVMISGCTSAWFYMVKKTLRFSSKLFVFDNDRTMAFLALILSLPKGIGRMFLPFLGIVTTAGTIYVLILWGITLIIGKYFPSTDILSIISQNFLVTSKELIKNINSLPDKDLIVLNFWYLSILITTAVLSFITLLWIPEVIYCERNPFKALINSIKKIIQTFGKTLLLYVFISVVSLLISICNTLLMFNPFSYFIVLLLYYYFIVYKVVLIFSYYEQTFIKQKN